MRGEEEEEERYPTEEEAASIAVVGRGPVIITGTGV